MEMDDSSISSNSSYLNSMSENACCNNISKKSKEEIIDGSKANP